MSYGPYVMELRLPYGMDQGSKSRKISYRAIVHDFVNGQNIFRARSVCSNFIRGFGNCQ